MSNFDGWWATVAVGIAALAWVVVTAMNARCRHRWEPTGRKHHTFPPLETQVLYKQHGIEVLPTLISTEVRCTECGTMRFFRDGA